MIPSYKEMMFPILKFIAEKGSASRKDVFEFVAKHFKLSEQELSLRIASGTLLYVSRAGWALTYFYGTKDLPENKKPLKKVDRGVYEITKFGKEILKGKDAFAKFNVWYDEIYKNKVQTNRENHQKSIQEKTPNDVIIDSSNELMQNLKSQILDEISQKDPSFFEYLVAKLLEKMGYGVSRLTKSGADGGIDGIVDEDELGLSKIYVQAKSWQGSVSRPEVQKFVGAISDKQTKKGVFITTSNFTKDARSYADGVQSHAVILIDGERLAELMIKYKLGVQVRQILEICDIDGDFFSY
ncbi:MULTISPECIES: restriction endonuclease [Campylobacter]|uniref:restriction endonuclease n=1 Tax=Campylobacter TaxID=194 RepID=UPI00027A378D|nr:MULTISPECIES: restriction endonuclease [Campylobacter]EJP76167.1 restriction endonuclease [Campylobacter sp. FOBRC14]